MHTPAAPSSGKNSWCGGTCALTHSCTAPGCRVCSSYSKSISVTNRLALVDSGKYSKDGTQVQCCQLADTCGSSTG